MTRKLRVKLIRVHSRSSDRTPGVVKALAFKRRGHTADGVADSAVVPVAEKVSEHKGFDLLHGHVLGVVPSVNGFGFEARPHALAFGIVMAAPAIGVHALLHAEATQAGPEIGAGILASPIGVENGAAYGVEARSRREALYHQGCLHVVVHGKSQAVVVEAVEHGGNVEIPISCWQLGDVADQLFTGSAGGKVSL